MATTQQATAGDGAAAALPSAARSRSGRPQRARLRALHEAALALAAPLGPEPAAVTRLLALIIERAVVALGAADGWVVLVEDPAWTALVPVPDGHEQFIRVEHTGALRRTTLRPGGVTRHVLTSGEAVVEQDLQAPGRFGPYDLLLERGVRSRITLPLRIENHMLGALAVNLDNPRSLTNEDLEALELFAAHATAALERVRWAAVERRRSGQAAATATILGEVGAATGVPDALEALVAGANRLLDGSGGTVQLYDPDTGLRRFQVVLHPDGRVVRTGEARPPIEGTFGARLVAGSPPILVEDFQALDPQTYPNYELMRQRGYRSSVNVPIVVGGRPIGSLHVNHTKVGFFTPADLSLATALAAQVGVVLQRAQMEEQRREAEAGRARLDGALLVARTVAHEINNGLAPISGYADLLAALPELATSAKAASFIEVIQAAIAQSTEKVRRLQSIIRLEETDSPLGPREPLLDLDRSTAP